MIQRAVDIERRHISYFLGGSFCSAPCSGGGVKAGTGLVISCSNGCTFLPTDEIFRVVSGCQQNADGNKPATMFLLLLKQQTGHLCRCT